ncbi:MAG TPA: ribulokinase [Phycisphaerales bacterium]|nr:ribulokinase [Phycisphaerales bacterium]
MTRHARTALGLDYGTSSVRAVIVAVDTGEELAASTWAYEHGTDGVILDDRDPNLARQHPADYLKGFIESVRGALAAARSIKGFDPSTICGIGVDTTGSTPIPVDKGGQPLGLRPEFQNEPAAMAWLWKDHTSHAQAAEITELAARQGRPYLAKCGGVYSSEWYWSKALRCEQTAPAIARAIHGWVELCDYIPAALTGDTRPEFISRSICAAGHKAMYHESWGGLPAEDFLESLQPGFSRFRRTYGPRAVPSNNRAGALCETMARATGLAAGIPIAVGALDAHMGAVGSHVGPGTLVKIIGTSTCDCMVAPLARPLPDIPGVCGIVPESIIPGMYGIEAGQSAVGDIFNWFVREMTGGKSDEHASLTAAAQRLRPGESGLVALDWHNGNRTVLVDPLLTGLIVGQTLHTTRAELYRALIEATAFGALKIIERIESFGVEIERVVNCGGIAEKNPLVMQIYADVCNRPMYIARSGQTCAVGSAIFASVVGGAHPDVQTAQHAMAGVRETIYRPIAANAEVYRELFGIYTRLHDAFGVKNASGLDLDRLMKDLIAIRTRARSA